MNYNNKKDVTTYKSLLKDYLINYHHININKPFNCLNPEHDDKHPSMMFTDKYNICKCFSCGVSYDIFDLIKLDYGAGSFKEQLEIVERLFSNVSQNDIKQFEIIETNENIDFTNYFSKCINNIDKTDYLNKRQIDNKLIKKYNIGYDENKKMIIFPINKYCYFGRGTNDNFKIKSKGISYLWNEKLLEDSSNKLIDVTESIIDSLSLETIDSNVKTISLNGLPNYKRLLKVIENKNYKGNIVLVFDNDKAGLTYQDIVKEELTKLNVNSFSTTLISNIDPDICKDINEALMKNRKQLEKNYHYFNDNFNKAIEQKEINEESELEL